MSAFAWAIKPDSGEIEIGLSSLMQLSGTSENALVERLKEVNRDEKTVVARFVGGTRDKSCVMSSIKVEGSGLAGAKEGLFYGLEQAGAIHGSPEEQAVLHAISHPPRTTRAYVRGRCVQKFSSAVLAAQWDHITLQGKHGPLKISLMDLFAPDDVLRYGIAVDAASSPENLRKLIS